MVLLLFGPPGCGKGTQSRFITDWLKIPAISTGDLLRAEIARGSELGRQAQETITSGRLVDDGLVNGLLDARIVSHDCKNGFLLDGYPRTVDQAGFLDQMLLERNFPEPAIVHLDVPADALVGRMTSRRVCPKCARVFNLLTARPKKPGICDSDGAILTVRKDDSEQVIRQRLREYDELTRPILAHYQYRNYHQISGDRSPKYIFEAITVALDPLILTEAKVASKNLNGHF